MKNKGFGFKQCCSFAAICVAAALLAILSVQKAAAAENKEYPYLIKVNRYHNTITVYEKDAKGKYSVPVKAFVCSTGTGTKTVLGTYNTKAKYRWKALNGNVWGQYSTRIVGGILFHSVYYYEYKNPGSLATNEYNKLGSPASQGCIRLTVKDAKWIYDNCPVGTTVVIYEDKKSPGPLGKPEAIKLPKSVRWDPTDPDPNNPYKDTKPKLYGIKAKTLQWGTEIDLLKGITAKSSVGTDITKNISVEGKVDVYNPGIYSIKYSVTDALGRSASKSVKITVRDPPEPAFNGVEDRIVPWNAKITKDYALEGVSASIGGKPVESGNIDVKIKLMDDFWQVSYSVFIGGSSYGKAKACFVIDREAPVLSGISDRTLEPGQIPDEQFALEGVTVTDNHVDITPEDIKVTIKKIPWHTTESLDVQEGEADIPDYAYLITYEVSDDVGNARVMTAVFHY